MKTRREFMAGAAILAAGSAVRPGRAIKTYGPVYFDVDIFGPVKLTTVLSADEERNLFEIKILSKDGQDLFVRLDLSRIRSVSVYGSTRTIAKVSNAEGEKCSMPVNVTKIRDILSFTTVWPNGDASSFVVTLSDVKKVL